MDGRSRFELLDFRHPEKWQNAMQLRDDMTSELVGAVEAFNKLRDASVRLDDIVDQYSPNEPAETRAPANEPRNVSGHCSSFTDALMQARNDETLVQRRDSYRYAAENTFLISGVNSEDQRVKASESSTAHDSSATLQNKRLTSHKHIGSCGGLQIAPLMPDLYKGVDCSHCQAAYDCSSRLAVNNGHLPDLRTEDFLYGESYEEAIFLSQNCQVQCLENRSSKERGVEDDILRAKWATDHARMKQCEKKICLLQHEMRRAVCFWEWKASEALKPVGASNRNAASAEVLFSGPRQSTIYQMLALSCASHWRRICIQFRLVDLWPEEEYHWSSSGHDDDEVDEYLCDEEAPTVVITEADDGGLVDDKSLSVAVCASC